MRFNRLSLFHGRSDRGLAGVSGPQALAVISCALAFLTAQPMPTASLHSTVTPAVAIAPAAMPIQTGFAPAARPLSAAPAAARQTPTPSAPAHRLNLLAAIIKHVLTAEWNTHQISPAAAFQPDAICLFDSSARPQRTALPSTPFFPPIPIERQFALAHCLLAPPIA